MNIKLSETHGLRFDGNSFIIYQDTGGREKIWGYFGEIESALQDYINECIGRSKATNIHSLLNYIKSLQTRLNKALQPLNLKLVGQNKKKMRKR